ncbi:MAG: hypothetical protein ABFD50_03770 [Smithella sp.]
MIPDKIDSRISRIKNLIMVITGSLLFVDVVVAFNMLGKILFGSIIASRLRATVTIELTVAMLSEIVVLVLLVFCLRCRGMGLRQIGLWNASPVRGWIAASF